MASVGSQLITPFNATSRGANRGKNDSGVPIVFLLLSMEPVSYDSSVSTTAANNGFTLRGLDALANRTTGVRAGSSFFNGYAPSVTPSQLGSANRRQIAMLNGVRNSPGKAYLQILVNDHPDGALTSAEATAMRTAINSVQPAPPNTAPVLSSVMNLTIPRDTMTDPIPVTVSDAETAATALTVTATSSNMALVPDTAITLGGSGMARTVKLTPAPGQTGTTTVTLTVTDGMLSAQRMFILAVADPYELWAAAQGLTAANRAAHLDPDNDGSVNLLEYFHGTPPLLSSAAPALVGSPGGVRFTFQRSRSAVFQPWVIESGTTPSQLTPWTPPAADVTTVINGDVEQISVRLPADARRFLRLRVTQ